MGMYEIEALDNIKYQIKEQQRETRELADDFYKQFDRAFSDAREANEQRYQAMKELTEQMQIGNAMQALQFGLQNNQFFYYVNQCCFHKYTFVKFLYIFVKFAQ